MTDHRVRVQLVAMLGVPLLLLVGGLGWLVASLLQPGPAPEVYRPASPVLIADVQGFSNVTAQGQPTVPLRADATVVPVQLGACAFVDRPTVAFTRTWEAFDPADGSRTRIAEQTATFDVRLNAGACAIVGSNLPVPQAVRAVAADHPTLVWRINWLAEPIGGRVATTRSEDFVIGEPAVGVRDRNDELQAELRQLGAVPSSP